MHRLHSAFAESGMIPHNQCAIIILQGPRQNFGSGGAEPADQNNQRAVIKARFVRGLRLDKIIGIFGLDHRAPPNKQARELFGFLQIASPVAAQIQDDPADFLLFQTSDQTRHIKTRARAFGAARIPRETGGLVIRIKRRQIDHPHARGRPHGLWLFIKLGFGRHIFQLNFIPHQCDELAHRGISGIGRNDGQRHLSALWSANHVHHLVQRHSDHIHRLPGILGHCDNAVSRVHLPALAGRSFLQLLNFAITVLAPEQCANAEKGKLHPDGKFPGLHVPHVVRVGIVSAGQ